MAVPVTWKTLYGLMVYYEPCMRFTEGSRLSHLPIPRVGTMHFLGVSRNTYEFRTFSEPRS